jgi:methylated-DNA-[protein]-cysteine S-methyltransferase
MDGLKKIYYQSPIGMIEIAGTEGGIYSILFEDEFKDVAYMEEEDIPKVLHDCYNQLYEYFKGIRKEFSLPFLIEGTDFQKKVWKALTTIPFGKTATYKDIAERIGNEKAVRAVGMTNSKNLISIIIPCHRVIGANGKLTGYAGGLWRKKWLLEHEGAVYKE